MYNHHAAHFGTDGDEFVAAAGHYGNKSRTLIKDYAENLGFEYFSACNKKSLKTFINGFLNLQLQINQCYLRYLLIVMTRVQHFK